MFSKIKKEWIFIFLFLTVALILFDILGVNYDRITGAQTSGITQENINAIRNAFEGLFRILFEGFAQPLFSVFGFDSTRIVIIRIFFFLFLFTVIYPVLSRSKIFGSVQEPFAAGAGRLNIANRRAAIVAALISLISAALFPQNVIEAFFGPAEPSIFSSLLTIAFIYGILILMIYGAHRIAGNNPAANRGNSIVAGITFLLLIFITIFITSSTIGNIKDNFLVVFIIAYAIALAWCAFWFFAYFVYYAFIAHQGAPVAAPLGGAGGAVAGGPFPPAGAGLVPGGAPAGPNRAQLRNILDNHRFFQIPLIAPFSGAGSNNRVMNNAMLQNMCNQLITDITNEDNAINPIQAAVLASITNVAQRTVVANALTQIYTANALIITNSTDLVNNMGVYNLNQRRARLNIIRNQLNNVKSDNINHI